MDADGIGARIRRARGSILTQKQLADLADVSVVLIRRLEQGSKQTARIGTLAKIARALDVDLADLLGQRSPVVSTNPNAGVLAMRRALSPVDDLLGDIATDEADGQDQPSLTDVERAVSYAWGEYWSGRYDALSATLPAMLPQARAAKHAAKPDELHRAADALARAYWVTGSVLVHLGQTDSAWQAIRLSLEAANQGDDELLAAALRGSVAWQLLVQGRYEESRAVCLAAARSIEPVGDVAPAHLSTYGSLILTAATAAGRDGNRTDAYHLADEASAVAERVGDERHDYETYFGPAQVTMQRVDVDVTTEDYDRALKTARQMPISNGLPLAARCRHMTDKALAHTRLGHQSQALSALLAAESLGPTWIERQTLPRRIVAELMDNAPPAKLRDLATRLGLAS